jgi:hypothetical protein
VRRLAGSRDRPDVDLKDEIEVDEAAAAAVAADLAATGDAEDGQAGDAVVPEAEVGAEVAAAAIHGLAAICRRRSTLRIGHTNRLPKRPAHPKNRICRRSCCPVNLSRSTRRGQPSR